MAPRGSSPRQYACPSYSRSGQIVHYAKRSRKGLCAGSDAAGHWRPYPLYVGEEIATAIARHREAPDAHTVIPAHLEGIPADAFALPYGLRVINGLDVPALGGVVGLAARLHELVTKWRGAPPVPPPPAVTTDPRCTPAALYDRLCKLLDVQFEEVIFRAELVRSQIAAPSAPQSRRALDVVGMVMQGGAPVCQRVCDAISRVAPWLT